MENYKQMGSSSSSSSSSSSIAMELFGPKEPSSSSSSFNSIFGSVLGPPPTVKGKDDSPAQGTQYSGNQAVSYNISQNSKEMSSYHQQETVGPCYLSSSIYYGGQEVYTPPTCNPDPQPAFKKDEQDGDPDGSNSHGASRGDWWQGSLYY